MESLRDFEVWCGGTDKQTNLQTNRQCTMPEHDKQTVCAQNDRIATDTQWNGIYPYNIVKGCLSVYVSMLTDKPIWFSFTM